MDFIPSASVGSCIFLVGQFCIFHNRHKGGHEQFDNMACMIIDILPKTVSQILMLTPFPYMFYFPVKIYLGQLSIADSLLGFLVLSVWTVVLIKCVKAVWQKGLRVYSAEGR